MPAMYSRLTAAAVIGTALQAIAETDENNTNDNATDNSSDNVTLDENNTNDNDNSSDNVTLDENNTDDNATDGNETDGGDGTTNGTVGGNANVTTGENASIDPSADNESSVPQVEVHVVKVTMETSTTLDFPAESNVSKLLETPAATAMTKAAIEKDMQKALGDTNTSSATGSRRSESGDAASSQWTVEVKSMTAVTVTRLDFDAVITKSVVSGSGDGPLPSETATAKISEEALFETKNFFDSLESLRLDELAAVYKATTGKMVPADFSVTSTSVSNETTTKVETEMRDDPEAIPASGTSTGSGSSSSGTGGTSGGSSSGGTGNGIVTDASGASGIALGLAGSVAFVLSALI